MNQCFFNELFFYIAIKMIEIINNLNFRLISKLMHNALAHTVIPWNIFLNSTNDWHVEIINQVLFFAIFQLLCCIHVCALENAGTDVDLHVLQCNPFNIEIGYFCIIQSRWSRNKLSFFEKHPRKLQKNLKVLFFLFFKQWTDFLPFEKWQKSYVSLQRSG